jgi:hypothetical protein
MPKVSQTKHDAKSLRNIAERASRAIEIIRAAGLVLEHNNIESPVVVKYHAEMVRGLKGISRFAYAASEAVHDAVAGEGFYVASTEQLERKIKTLESDLKKAQLKIAETEAKYGVKKKRGKKE